MSFLWPVGSTRPISSHPIPRRRCWNTASSGERASENGRQGRLFSFLGGRMLPGTAPLSISCFLHPWSRPNRVHRRTEIRYKGQRWNIVYVNPVILVEVSKLRWIYMDMCRKFLINAHPTINCCTSVSGCENDQCKDPAAIRVLHTALLSAAGWEYKIQVT